MVEFSVPLFFEDDFLSNVKNLHKSVKKSRITSVYACFPQNIGVTSGFEQIRVARFPGIETPQDFFEYVKKVQDAGIKFIYLFNTPRSMTELEFYENTDNLKRFLEMLLTHGVNIVRVTNIQIIDFITKFYPEFEIRCSTSQEYYSIRQYRNLFERYPNITEVVPNWDMNKNFTFLRDFKAAFTKRIELMVNDGCLPGCPFRSNHHSSMPTGRKYEPLSISRLPCYKIDDFATICSSVYHQNTWKNIMLSNIIYPWEIETYEKKYGIINFKIIGRNLPLERFDGDSYFKLIEVYVMGFEDFEYVANEKFRYFNFYLSTCNNHPNFDLPIKEVRKYLPSIEYFERNGHRCSNVCGVECKYCFYLAEKINSVYPFYK